MTSRARTRRGKRRTAARPATNQAAAFTPDALSVGARHLEVGNEWVSSFAITGFPREIHPGWLAPLLTYPGRLDVALHVEPIAPATAAARSQSGPDSVDVHGSSTGAKINSVDSGVIAALPSLRMPLRPKALL